MTSIYSCIHYNYPDVIQYPGVDGGSGYIIDGDQRISVTLFDNEDILRELGIDSMAILENDGDSAFIVSIEVMELCLGL